MPKGKITTEALSLDDIHRQVRTQIHDMVPSSDNMDDGPYVSEVYLTDAIVELNGEFYRVPYGQDGVTVTVAPRSEWKKVTKEWVTAESARHAKVKTSYFAELVDLSEAELDNTRHAARVTLIRPGWSENNRYYSREVLAAAAPLFEGVKAYADHPAKSELKDRPERSVRDITGWYENVRIEQDGRMTGDRRVIGHAVEWLWPMVEAAVTEKSDLFGISINALGKTRMGEAEGKRGVIVESIVGANSADDVTTPAAGGKYDSLLMSDGDAFTQSLLENLEFDEWRAARPEFVDQLKKEWKTTRDNDALVAARAESAELAEKLEAAQKELAEARTAARTAQKELQETQAKYARDLWQSQVDMVLAGVQLPEEWKRDLRPQLLEAADLSEAQDVIKAEMSKLKAVRGKVVVRGAGRSAPAQSIGEARPANPVAARLGVSNPALPGETPAQYQARIRKQQSH